MLNIQQGVSNSIENRIASENYDDNALNHSLLLSIQFISDTTYALICENDKFVLIKFPLFT